MFHFYHLIMQILIFIFRRPHQVLITLNHPHTIVQIVYTLWKWRCWCWWSSQTINQLHILLSYYEPTDVYNMDKTRFYYIVYLNKTLAQEKVKGRKLQKKRVTLAHVVNSTWLGKLKLLVIYKCKQPQYFVT